MKVLLLSIFVVAAASNYQMFHGKTAYSGHGGTEIDSDATAPRGFTVNSCKSRCDADLSCACASFRPADGKCWKRGACVPSQFGSDDHFDTYVKVTAGNFMRYAGKNSYTNHGGIALDSDSTAPAGLSVEGCETHCSTDDACACITYRPSDGKCWNRAACQPSQFASDAGYDTYVKTIAPSPFSWIANIASSAGGQFKLEAKTYYIDKQYQLPANTEIHGAGSGGGGTIVKALGVMYDGICYSNANNRKGFLLGDNSYIGKLHFVGMESKRFSDNQLLCGGAPFETPGCAGTGMFAEAPRSCGGDTGSGQGIQNATLEDITIESMTVQNAFYMAPTRAGTKASKDITVLKLVCNGTWADGMNIHGAHENVLIRDCEIRNSGDDNYAIWSVGVLGADNITFVNNVAVDPWYRPGGSSAAVGYRNSDNCFAVYGGQKSTFLDNTCTGGHDAIVIFGNDQHKTYGGQFTSESFTRVQGNRGLDKTYPPCYFGVHFPGKTICEAAELVSISAGKPFSI